MAAHAKRDLIVLTLQQLQDAMPEDGSASQARSQCCKLADRVSYTAPELMDYVWHRIYQFLRAEVPYHECVDVWNRAHAQYEQLT